MNYIGKNIIITGGTGGICAELAKEFLRQGAQNIALLDIADPDNVTATLQSEFSDKKVIYFKVDVRHRDEIQNIFRQFVEQFGYVDIVISGAGILNENKPEDTVAINLIGVINTTYEAIEWMSISKNGRGGLVANIASQTGILFFPQLPVYGATKHAVLGFTKSMANETNKKLHGIDFVTICPSKTETSMARNDLTQKFAPDFVQEGCELFSSLPGQSPAEVAVHVCKILAREKNGAIWVIEDNKCIEFTPNTYTI